MKKIFFYGRLFLTCLLITLASCDSNKNGQVTTQSNKDSIVESPKIQDKLNEPQLKEEVIYFEDVFGNAPNQRASYELRFNGEDVIIVYKYSDSYTSVDTAKFKNGKIILYEDCPDCIEVNNDKFCMHNGETDSYDCYNFVRSKSTCSFNDILNRDSKSNNSNTNNTVRFHDVEQELSHKLQKEIVPYLGKPDAKGVINHCGQYFAYFFVYFNKVRNDNDQIRHLVILTTGNQGVKEGAFGEIYSIETAEEGDKIFPGWQDGCWGKDEYIKIQKSGITSNSREFEIR